MTNSIFSNLPNNLIIDIIKMAEDQRKKEENEAHKKKFKNVIQQFNEVEKSMLDDYSRDERDQYWAQ